jgi:hypothetical protein
MSNDLKYTFFKLEYNMPQFIVIIIIIIIVIDVVIPFLYTTAMIITLVRFPCSKHIKYYLEYSAVYGFCPVEGVNGAGGRACCVWQVARSGCLFSWNFSVTRSTDLREAEREEWTKHDAVTALVTRS